MTDKNNKKKQGKKAIQQTGLADPSGDFYNFGGDPTGISGATVSTKPSKHQTKDQVSDKIYDNNTLLRMSKDRAKINKDYASEKDAIEEIPSELPEDTSIEERTGEAQDLAVKGNETAADAERDTLTSEAPFTHVDNLGEQDALGGSASAPESGEDSDAQGARVGFDHDENHDGDGYGNDEVDIAEQIDKAEEYHRTH